MHRPLIIAAIVVAFLGGGAEAASIGFTNRAVFDAAVLLFQNPETVDFGDATVTSTTIPSGNTFDGITFTYTIGTHTLRVTDAFGTTSPPNSLGLDTADDAFIGGDAFDMTLNRSVNALGLYVIGESIAVGDLTLTIGTGGSVSNGAADSAVSDGEVFFLGLIDTTDFTTANLSSFAEFYPFNVDDIYTAVAPPPGAENPVPEPTTLALCAAGALGVAVWRRRRALTLALALMLGGTLPATANAACLVGEVVFWGGDFIPVGWLPLDGTLRSREDFPELADLIAFRFGPPPIGFFRLPDLAARTPLGTTGQNSGLTTRLLGSKGGTETVTLTPQQLAAHSHPAIASDNVATSTDPHGNLWAAQSRTPLFGPPAATPAPMHPSAITSTGGDQPHENMSPFLTLTPIICAIGPAPEPRP